jgi:hypothetical protein
LPRLFLTGSADWLLYLNLQEFGYMVIHLILAGIALAAIFIMFLVISRTLNNIINLLIKLEYLIQKEFDLKKETLEVQRLMEDRPGPSKSASSRLLKDIDTKS